MIVELMTVGNYMTAHLVLFVIFKNCENQTPFRGHLGNDTKVIQGTDMLVLLIWSWTDEKLPTVDFLVTYPFKPFRPQEHLVTASFLRNLLPIPVINGFLFLWSFYFSHAGFLTAREVTQACTINGIYFRKGMSVFIPIHAFHHDEAYFPDPETYKPERFLPENKGSINPYTYMPFGMGPRNCIGMRMALLEMRVILVRMLQKYRLLKCPETRVPIKVKPKTVLCPAEPVMIQAERRIWVMSLT